MASPSSPQGLSAVLRDIIEGKIVKRSRHELRWDTDDLSTEFIAALREAGYHETAVESVAIEPGIRVPAFSIHDGIAYFGWVFWEKFSSLRLRKLFGSVVRNDKGDWAVQISGKRTVFVNPALKSEMDIDNPSGM